MRVRLIPVLTVPRDIVFVPVSAVKWCWLFVLVFEIVMLPVWDAWLIWLIVGPVVWWAFWAVQFRKDPWVAEKLAARYATGSLVWLRGGGFARRGVKRYVA